MSDDPTMNRGLGCLLGLAIGDALGTTLEFTSRDARPPLTDMIGGGPFGLEPGEWTDDTSMALGLAQSLLECGKLDQLDLMQRFVRWWRDSENSSNGKCCDIGVTTRSALARLLRTGSPAAGSTDPEAQGTVR
jgi:ADP-ribosylglycohydrolase